MVDKKGSDETDVNDKIREVLIFVVDFDGTCVEDEFPAVGKSAYMAVETMKEIVEAGHKINLSTMRSGYYLEPAVYWFKENGISLHGIQKDPNQHKWTGSPKCFGHIIIDDRAFGMPMIFPEGSEKPCVDWVTIRNRLIELGIIGDPAIAEKPAISDPFLENRYGILRVPRLLQLQVDPMELTGYINRTISVLSEFDQEGGDGDLVYRGYSTSFDVKPKDTDLIPVYILKKSQNGLLFFEKRVK